MKHKPFSILVLFIIGLIIPYTSLAGSRLYEIDKVIKEYGKEVIINIILDERGSAITIQVDNKMVESIGLPDSKYVNKYTISNDLRIMRMSVQELKNEIEKIIAHVEKERKIITEKKVKEKREHMSQPTIASVHEEHSKKEKSVGSHVSSFSPAMKEALFGRVPTETYVEPGTGTKRKLKISEEYPGVKTYIIDGISITEAGGMFSALHPKTRKLITSPSMHVMKEELGLIPKKRYEPPKIKRYKRIMDRSDPRFNEKNYNWTLLCLAQGHLIGIDEGLKMNYTTGEVWGKGLRYNLDKFDIPKDKPMAYWDFLKKVYYGEGKEYLFEGIKNAFMKKMELSPTPYETSKEYNKQTFKEAEKQSKRLASVSQDSTQNRDPSKSTRIKERTKPFPADLTYNEVGYLLALIREETGECDCKVRDAFEYTQGSKNFYGEHQDLYFVGCLDGRKFLLIHGPRPPFWRVIKADSSGSFSHGVIRAPEVKIPPGETK